MRKSIQKFINTQSMLADSVEKIQQENDEEAIHLLGLLRKRLLSVPQESLGNEGVLEKEISGIHFAMCRSLER